MSWMIEQGHVLSVLRAMPDNSVDVCVTSPPYFALRDYKTEPQLWADGWVGQLGLEPTPALFIAHLVEIFREVRRVLLPTGTCWVNMGDSFAGSMGGSFKSDKAWEGQIERARASGYSPGVRARTPYLTGRAKADQYGFKPKDLLMIPARLAIALQDDGWWLRADIIWAKPAPMPESVTDRPTKSHEHIFLLTKNARYYYDRIAVLEPSADERMGRDGSRQRRGRAGGDRVAAGSNRPDGIDPSANGGRNLRDVWTINYEPTSAEHYAAFPREIPRKAIRAGSSAKGRCPECKKPWVRVVQKQGGTWEARKALGHPMHYGLLPPRGAASDSATQTTGWVPSCKCGLEPEPPVVLDPFCGTGTTLAVAIEQHRTGFGIELQPKYVEIAQRRLERTQPLLLLPDLELQQAREVASTPEPAQVSMFQAEYE